MKRLLAPLLLCTLLLSAGPGAVHAGSGTSAPGSATAQYVCMIVLDAGRPDYITANLGSMPNMRAFLQHARTYDQAWVGSLMSITPPDHAVIGSGSFPKNDGGIVNWEWGDHKTGKISPTFQALVNYQNGWAFRVIKDSGTPTLAQVVHQKYPTGLVIAGSGAHFHAAGPMGGPDANWIYSYERINGYWAPFTLGQRPVPARLLNDPSLRARLVSSNNSTVPLLYDPLPLGQQDTLAVNFAIRALQVYRPRVTMVNLPEPDTIGHWSQRWYPEQAVVYRAFDRDLGRLIAAYKQAGIYNQTLFVITADHGMIQQHHRVLDTQQLRAVLNGVGAHTILVNGGGKGGPTMTSVWLKDPSLNRKAAQAIYRRRLDNVTAVFYMHHKNGRYYYNMAGCEQCSADLIKAYRYLLSTEDGPTGEDIAILLRENTGNSGLPIMPGRHGGADWGSQHLSLIMSGPDIQTGVSHHPARLADIAPTIERAMAIAPQARDGLVLADAFQHPNASDTAAQNRSDAVLSVYVNALSHRAQSDLVLEREGKLPNHIPSDEVIIHWKRRWAVTIAGAAVLIIAGIGLWWAVGEVRRQGTGLDWSA